MAGLFVGAGERVAQIRLDFQNSVSGWHRFRPPLWPLGVPSLPEQAHGVERFTAQLTVRLVSLDLSAAYGCQ